METQGGFAWSFWRRVHQNNREKKLNQKRKPNRGTLTWQKGFSKGEMRSKVNWLMRVAKLARLPRQEFTWHFNLKAFLCIHEHKVMAMCPLPAYRLKGTCSFALCHWFRSCICGVVRWAGRSTSKQSSTHRSQLESPFWVILLECRIYFPRETVINGPARPDLLTLIELSMLTLLSFCTVNFLEHPNFIFSIITKKKMWE